MINVKELRAKLGWSQDRLARELRVAPFTIRRWERGQNKMNPGNEERLEELTKRIGKQNAEG